jgi:adenosylhomocysteine nucleosidase
MKNRFNFVELSALLFLVFTACTDKEGSFSRPIAILGAFTEEIEMLTDSLENARTIEVLGMEFYQGDLAGHEVVIAYTGIGKVNAAMTTTLLLQSFHPSRVIFTGIAGGINPDLDPADLIISERCVHHDLNYIYDDTLVSYQPLNPVTAIKNPVFFHADSTMLKLAEKAAGKLILEPVVFLDDTLYPDIRIGTIATGDAFIASGQKGLELIRRFQADAVEMEGAAVAQVCYQQGVPFIIIRSISDSANEHATADLEDFYLISAGNANLMVLGLLREMKD